VNRLAKTLDFTDVPYLEEMLSHLPINGTDKEDVNTYLRNVTNSILVNYNSEQYQFAYFGLHLLYMTYIYFSVRKISMIIPERYKDAVIFAKPYRGRERELDFNNLESTFDFSLVAERELPNILKIIGLNDGQIGKIGGLVDARNEMAHAKGRFEILNEEAFSASANGICDSVRNIHSCMDKQIRLWFQDVLIKYCNGDFKDYTDIRDIIEEQMIQNFNLSVNELLVCNEMSVRDIITDNRQFEENLKKFKTNLREYCENNRYV
jgi:hypothetical protein